MLLLPHIETEEEGLRDVPTEIRFEVNEVPPATFFRRVYPEPSLLAQKL